MKLPITPLLYLVSLASLGGIGHAVYQYSDKTNDYDAKARDKIKKENKRLKAEGIAAKDLNNERWDYRKTWFWKQLADVNLTGKIEKKDEPKKLEKEVETELKPEIVQLKDIIEVICIARAGDETGVVIKYTADVEVPENEVVTSSTPSLKNTIPRGRQRGRRRPTPQPAPTQTIGQFPPHHVEVGEALWPKYNFVYLKSVAPDASFATFELRIDDKKDEKGAYPTQDVIKGTLDLPPEILAKMRAGIPLRTDDKGQPIPRKVERSDWVDTPTTTVSRQTGRVNVSRKDQEFLEKDGANVFTDDVHMRDYSGGSGKYKIRGVQFKKLSGRVRQFGVNEGDVLISINDQKVSGMANAKKVGRRLYNKGVRNFRAEILRQGRIITRTYSFKK
jgi:hypothetical protein